MAVVKNFWLRDNKQKLGGAVIYQANGQTLMRQLAPSVSNPRTDAQMETRVKLANLVAFYRASVRWMRGSFETKPTNQSDYNAFVSANAASNNVWLSKKQVDAANAVVAPYIISKGSLGEIIQTESGGSIYTNLYVGTLSVADNLTVAALSTALIANNNGLQENDQISIIQYIQNTSTNGNYTIVCRPFEMILNTSNTELVSKYLPISLLNFGAPQSSALGIIADGFTGGVAFVLSRTIGGRILVSTSSVTLTPNNSVYESMTSSLQKETAISSYGTSTVTFLDPSLAEAINTISTEVRILNIMWRNKIYSPGSEINPDDMGGEEITINLSGQIPASSAAVEGAFKSLTNSPRVQTIFIQAHGVTNTLTATVEDDTPFGSESEGVNLILEIPTSIGTITANYQMPGDGNGEGLS